MSYTKPTVNERLKMLVNTLEQVLKDTIANEMLTRERVDKVERRLDLIEYNGVKYCVECGTAMLKIKSQDGDVKQVCTECFRPTEEVPS